MAGINQHHTNILQHKQAHADAKREQILQNRPC
jgi:hypothetical protein